MDFVVALPPNKGFDAITAWVDQFMKQVHLRASRKADHSHDVADTYLDTVFKHHSFPRILITDRDPRFGAKFWKQFCKY